jgi:hypothetical protein
MLNSQLDYRLVSFGEDELSPDLFAQAERVYLDSIGTTARTSTNEIAFWKDRYNAKYAEAGDKLFVFGFESKSEMIGFALVFYYRAQSLVVVDHIAIKEPSRNFGAFFEFKKLMAQHILERGHQVDYVVAEIVTSQAGDPHPVEPQLLIQLLKQSGFHVAHLEYYTPSILEREYGFRIEAALMISRNDRAKSISSASLSALIDCILDDLYLRWYQNSKSSKAFRSQIESLRTLYRSQLSKADFVELNGNWNERHVAVVAKRRTVQRRSESGTIKNNVLPPAQGVPAPSLLLLLLVVVCAALAGISYIFGLSVFGVIIIFFSALFALLSLLSIWYRQAGSQAKSVLALISKLLRGNKDVS